MKVTKQKSLCHEDYGATLKHKCGKRIVELSPKKRKKAKKRKAQKKRKKQKKGK